jgi:hypothetical protein
MKGISFPEPVLFPRAGLNLGRQTIEMGPEVTVRPRDHGISRRRPARMSSSTSRRMRSNFPAATSRLICSSHSSSCQPWSQAASSARSSNESCSIAVLICSTLTSSTIGNYALNRNARRYVRLLLLVPKLYLGTPFVFEAELRSLRRVLRRRSATSCEDAVPKCNLGTRGLPKMDATSRCSTLEAGFGEVDVVLDAAQDFVADGLFVAQGDDGVAFCFQGFPGQFFKVPRE